MRRSFLIALALLVAGSLAAAGCGGSSSSGGGATSAPATSTGGSGGASSGPVQVKMQNIQFAPQSVTVKVGQKVTWVNDDSLEHNVNSTSGAQINSGNFGQGKSFSFTPTKAGTIAYVCTLHPGMQGTLTVVQ